MVNQLGTLGYQAVLLGFNKVFHKKTTVVVKSLDGATQGVFKNQPRYYSNEYDVPNADKDPPHLDAG